MANDLFSKPALYTIDSSSLIAIFGDESMLSKKYIPGLWDRILDLINQGVIISHVEVFHELKKDGTKGEELFEWARANEAVFRDYKWEAEGRIIKTMSPKYNGFVNAKISSIHADPWLVAQAKSKKIKIISEETMSYSADVKKYKLPNVCADPAFDVGCIDLWGLTKEQNWKFR